MLEKYAELAKHKGFSKAARQLLNDHPDFPLSHRTIRRRLSEMCSILEVKNEKEFNYKGEKPITSQEEAVEFFKINLNKEEIIKSVYNAWDVTLKEQDGSVVKRTNYQVKLFTRPRQPIINYDVFYKQLQQNVKSYKLNVSKGSGVGMAIITDIHVGAETKGLINTKDFNLNSLMDCLNQAAEIINTHNKKEVHVAILGDLIESFTGLNHINSWQGIHTYGADALILSYEILFEFLSKIKNLKQIYMVSGNHDRVHENKEVDVKGYVSHIIAYMLSKNFKIKHHSMVISTLIDNISYILHHGHLKLSQQSFSKIILDYGNQKCYNVLVKGHFHSRAKQQEFVHFDSSNYRGITVAPIFTGNQYAESHGWTSSSGFSFIEASHKKNNINHYDYAL